jgi:L-alanine-DL-glutamate epimerase-like enolase superfamily enzyme
MTFRARVIALSSAPLAVPLVEPFVIATARMDATRARVVRITLEDERGRRATGIGEAATLPPVTHEDEHDVAESLSRAAAAMIGATLDVEALGEWLAEAPVARASVETAWLDAWGKLVDQPMAALLGGRRVERLVTDVTLPIGRPEAMADLARQWRSRGFSLFKVKVGRSLDDDLRALEAIAAAVPDARLRIDANAGYGLDAARALLAFAERTSLPLEHFEQPCARDDLDAMAALTRTSAVPIIADESVRTLDDLERVIAAKAAHGVNMKLVKAGGPIASYAIGARARAAGMSLMCGAMVETRLGLSAMAQVVSALGGVEYVDLDTAFLLDGDPFTGGYEAHGAELVLEHATGHGVRERDAQS